MTQQQWEAFVEFKETFRERCNTWLSLSAELIPLQKSACKKDTPEYPLETPVVYNTAYDAIQPTDHIKLLVVGDNPGKEEQLHKKCSYLVGQSGRIAEGFFRRNADVGIDFRKNVIILNKTPIHTAKTAHLRFLQKNGSENIQNIILQSQKEMAHLTAVLHKKLLRDDAHIQLWLVGYAELKKNGIFLPYRDELFSEYADVGKDGAAWDAVCVFQHFSMNRFLIDLKTYQEKNKELSTTSALTNLGHLHRDEIFGEKISKGKLFQ